MKIGNIWMVLVPLALSPTAAWAESDRACFYEHPSYQGNEICLSADNPSLVGHALNDRISSIRLYGDALVTIFADPNFAGPSTTVMHDVFRMGHLNDAVTSIRFGTRTRNDFACLYEHGGYDGTPICAQAGQTLNTIGGLNNAGTSLLLTGSAEVEAFSGIGLTGTSATLARSFSALPGAWNDNIESLRVQDRKGPSAIITNSYTRAAIHQQGRLLTESPYANTSWIGSHNSYNSDAYGRYNVNHYLSLAEQLELGARVLEIDVHGGDGWAVDVCHGVGPECSNTVEGGLYRLLSELKNWLKGAGENDMVLIKLEDQLYDKAAYATVRQQIESTLGDMLLRPVASGSCLKPTPASIRELRQAQPNARVLFFFYNYGFSQGCNSDALAAGIERVVFARGGIEPSPSHNYNYSCPAGLPNEPGAISLITEDRRTGQTPQRAVPSEQILPALRCGLSAVAADKWVADDSRLYSNLWANYVGGTAEGSVGYFQPSSDYAPYDVTFGAENHTSTVSRHFICRHSNGALDYTRTGTGPWSAGQQVCSSEFPGSHFSLPVNALEAAAFAQLLVQTGHSLERYWINYRRLGAEWVPDLHLSQFALRERSRGLCMDVENGNAVGGARVGVATCTGGERQGWYYEQSLSRLHSAQDPTLCLSHYGPSNAIRYGNLALEVCADSDDQRFDFIGGKLRNRYAANVVIDAFGGPSSALIQYTADGASAGYQLWDKVYPYAALHRYLVSTGQHFYTTTPAEISGLPGYVDEGALGYVHNVAAPGTLPLYRYRYTGPGGGHFYSTNENEVSNDPAWQAEGVAGHVYTSTAAGRVPVHRYRSTTRVEYFYTQNDTELGAGNSNWVYEGIAYYVLANP
jgi:hypothetical protein